MDGLPLTHPPTWVMAQNPGMCLDWELNQQTLGSQGGAQPTESPARAPLQFLKVHVECLNTSSKQVIQLCFSKTLVKLLSSISLHLDLCLLNRNVIFQILDQIVKLWKSISGN